MPHKMLHYKSPAEKGKGYSNGYGKGKSKGKGKTGSYPTGTKGYGGKGYGDKSSMFSVAPWRGNWNDISWGQWQGYEQDRGDIVLMNFRTGDKTRPSENTW